eukprot:3066345-Prymnesium_polylepis.1
MRTFRKGNFQLPPQDNVRVIGWRHIPTRRRVARPLFSDLSWRVATAHVSTRTRITMSRTSDESSINMTRFEVVAHRSHS